MATRKVLQEIPILPPETEEQSFLIVAEEAISDICNKMSFPARAHAKYISTDEAKENIIPAELDGNMYNYGKSDFGKPADLMECPNLGDQERFGLGRDISAGSGSITPRKDTHGSDWRIGESNTPINFSNVTVDDFGISSESFTNCVGKSPRTLHKHRRRSTIGVRGSPEMNFLIRQIALQRSKKTSPEPLSNPFISPRNSILKEKMSSFRNAFQAVEESEGKLPFPGFSEEEEETKCNTLGRKSYGNMCEKPEPPVKRKRVCVNSLPEVPLISTQPPMATQETEQVHLLEKISESGSTASRLFTAVSNSGSGFSLCGKVNVQNEEIPPVPSSTRGQKRKVMFADLLSPPESRTTLCHNPTYSFDSHTSSSSVLRPVLKKTSRKEFSSSRDEIDQRVSFAVPELSENGNNTLFKKTVNDSVKKKKSVTFGKELSPELFDKSLPANTPLRKGSTPYRQQASDTATLTAQEAVHQSPCQPFLQPDFDCRDEEDTFKPLSLSFDTEPPTQDSTISPGNHDLVWPIDELEDMTQENNHKEEDETLLISFDFPENTTTDAPAIDTDIANETFIACEPDAVRTNRVTRSSKSNACISEDPSTADNSKVQVSATAKPSKRGRKPGSIKRVMVKVPRVKAKKGRGRPKKSTQKPFYGERELVSKKPLLSPIPEQPECYPTPPASTHVSPSGSLKKGLVKRITKRKGIRRGNRNVEKSKVHSEVGELFSDPIILKIEGVFEDSGCPGQEDLEVKHMESLTDSQGHTQPADLVVQVSTVSTNAVCPLSSADKEMKRDEDYVPEPGESVPEDTNTTETVSALKPQKPKRRSSTRRRVSQTPIEVQHAANPEAATDLLENIIIAEHKTLETITEGPKPKTDLLVEDRAPSPKLPVITDVAKGKKGRRLSRNYQKPAIFYSSTEPNTYTRDPCIILPQSDENSTTFTSEPYLPFDGILQSTGTEKKVRRSLRLRRDSGASGLSWVSETTSSEGTSRRKSLSSAVQPLGNSNLILESVTCSPNKEQLSVQHIPGAAKWKSLSSAMQSLENKLILESVTHSPKKEQLSIKQVPGAVKKTRRRTLCSSTLQQMTSLGDTKRRRSDVSYKDSYAPAEPQTCHNNVMLDT